MTLFIIDALAITMLSLIWFVFISIVHFSKQYLAGDRKQTTFYLNISALVLFPSLMVTANHVALFFISWCASNFFLVLLMGHKFEWKAAKESALLAGKNFAIGATAIGTALFLLYQQTSSLFINDIIGKTVHPAIAILMIAGAMTQSALWPFHGWLLSSLNSPTPVSAIMHAGLINGGGFLLVRFAPLFYNNSLLLHIIFTLGMITAVLGSLWQLVQTDIKRLLASSTMGQMGFMIAQCGLGLFPAAIAHLAWHGLFKAYLFLASGSAAQRKRFQYAIPTLQEFLFALICGILAAYSFIQVLHIEILAFDTNLILAILIVMAGVQFSLPMIKKNTLLKNSIALITTPFMGAWYGIAVYSIEKHIPIYQAQPISIIHIIGISVLVLGWLLLLFEQHKTKSPWTMRWYMYAVNASQPDAKTITTHRNQYQYK